MHGSFAYNSVSFGQCLCLCNPFLIETQTLPIPREISSRPSELVPASETHSFRVLYLMYAGHVGYSFCPASLT